MKTTLVVSTTVVVIVALAFVAGPTTVECKSPIIQACGKELADILQNTCRRGYNAYYSTEVEENSMNGMRKKSGITGECCLQACSFADLLQYCSGGSSVNVLDSQNADSEPKGTDTGCNNDPKRIINNEILPPNSKDPCETISSPKGSVPIPSTLNEERDAANVTRKTGIHSLSSSSTGSTHVSLFDRKFVNATPPIGRHSSKPYYVNPPVIIISIADKFGFRDVRSSKKS